MSTCSVEPLLSSGLILSAVVTVNKIGNARTTPTFRRILYVIVPGERRTISCGTPFKDSESVGLSVSHSVGPFWHQAYSDFDEQMSVWGVGEGEENCDENEVMS
jgi:hypothetical protein